MAQAGSTGTGSWLVLILMFALLYFIMVVPQRKKTKQEEQMRAELSIGDEVVTAGGIIGIVISLKDNTIIIETGNDRCHIRFLRSAIARNVTAEDRAKEIAETNAAKKKASKNLKKKEDKVKDK